MVRVESTWEGCDIFFFGSEAPGLVFSMPYLRGTRLRRAKFCALRHSPPLVELRFPPQISPEKTAPSRQSLRKDITTLPL